MPRSPVLAVLLLVGIAGAACGSDGDSSPESQVLSANNCPEERCVDVGAALDEIGWAFLEPSELPAGFDLYSRIVQRDPPAPGMQPGESSYTVLQEFRFQGSQNVPGIVIVQSRPLGDSPAIRPQSEDCGQLQESAIGPMYYSEGLVRLLAVPEENLWLVCMDETAGHGATHSVILVTEGVLIEIIAFPEAGVSRDDILELVDSLLPASATPD